MCVGNIVLHEVKSPATAARRRAAALGAASRRALARAGSCQLHAAAACTTNLLKLHFEHDKNMCTYKFHFIAGQ